MPPRFLTRSEVGSAIAASKLSLEQRRAFAEKFDRSVFRAWDGWNWGRRSFAMSVARPDIPPLGVELRRLCTLEATEYIARKRDRDGRARRAVYRHLHDRPYASIVSTIDGAESWDVPGERAMLSSRTAPTFAGPAMFVLGELYALEGTDETGARIYWKAPRDLLLVGCPFTDTMHVVRTGAARKSVAPVWIVRGRSPYRLTDRGIEK